MPRSASSPQYLETRRLSKNQLFAMRAAHEEGLGWDTRRPSDHNYLFVPGRLLVDTEDAGLDQVVDVFNRRKSDFRITSAPERDDARTPKIDSLDSYRFSSRERLPDESDAAYERARRRDLVNAVRIYDDELGPGVVTPEHYVHLAGTGNGRACPATEPAEAVLAQAWPPEETDKTVGDKIRVVVIDTGWPQPADEAAAAADVNAGHYGQLPALPPYAGHGMFAEEVVRSHAPGADISHLEFPITNGGVVNEVDLAHLLQQALALNPQVINLSAGCHTRHDRPLKAFERVWRNQSTDPKDRPVVIAAAGNDASPSPFYPQRRRGRSGSARSTRTTRSRASRTTASLPTSSSSAATTSTASPWAGTPATGRRTWATTGCSRRATRAGAGRRSPRHSSRGSSRPTCRATRARPARGPGT